MVAGRKQQVAGGGGRRGDGGEVGGEGGDVEGSEEALCFYLLFYVLAPSAPAQ